MSLVAERIGPNSRRVSPSDEFNLRTLVIQPTGFCNIDCQYCYLKSRIDKKVMSTDIALAVADSLIQTKEKINLVWHSGEPLTIGTKKFATLLQIFESLRLNGKISHAIQTNGTLINDEWCNLFEQYDVTVGLSLDGTLLQNVARLNRAGKSTFESASRAAKLLSDRKIDFNCIAVITHHNVNEPAGLYEFFKSLGCDRLAINIVEMDGDATFPIPTKLEVTQFWKGLFCAWKSDPILKIREFDAVLGWLKATTQQKSRKWNRDWVASVDLRGDVRVLSPELSEVTSDKYSNFIIGNALSSNIYRLLELARNAPYVTEYLNGCKLCAKECEYYDFCYGGSASNKYAELGRLDATETLFCINSRKSVVNAVLEGLLGAENGQFGEILIGQ